MKSSKVKRKRRFLGMTGIQTSIIFTLGGMACMSIMALFGFVVYFNLPMQSSSPQIPIPATRTLPPTYTALPSVTARPTNTPLPTTTKTLTPTPTSLLYTADARDYVLSESEVPNGFFVLPEQTGRQTAHTSSGFISGYIVTYKNGNSGIVGVLSPSGYLFSIQIFVFDNSNDATKEFEYRISLTKESENEIVRSAGDKAIEGCDQAHLLLGVFDLDGLVTNNASLICQKENVVSVVTSIGAVGAPSFGIDLDIDTATKNRINEVRYYTDLVLNKIK